MGRAEADEPTLPDDLVQSNRSGQQSESGDLDEIEHLRRWRSVAVMQLSLDGLEVGLTTNFGEPLVHL